MKYKIYHLINIAACPFNILLHLDFCLKNITAGIVPSDCQQREEASQTFTTGVGPVTLERL
jgi:hypothetical protein